MNSMVPAPYSMFGSLFALAVILAGITAPISGQAQELPRPYINVSLGQTCEGVVFHGESLLVRVQVGVNEANDSLVLSAPQGPWTTLFRVILRDAQGRTVGVPASHVGSTGERSARLAARRYARAAWQWTRGQIAAIPAGTYSVVAQLEGPAGPEESEAMQVQIASFPAMPTQLQAAHRARAVSRAQASEGDSIGAEKTLDAWLIDHGDDAEALMARAELRRARGDLVGALLDANQAIGSDSGHGAPPAAAQLRFRSEVLHAITSTAGAGTSPGTASRPPARTSVASSSARSSPTTEAPAPVAAGANGFAGEWITNFGAMTLVVNGNDVTGSYPRNGGRIKGTIDGGVLRFEWTQTNNRGRGVFRIAPDGRSFTGTFAYGAGDPEASRNTWNGTRAP